MGNLQDLKPTPAKAPQKAFKAYEPGFVHIDVKYLPQMADQSSRSYLFVAIDRATRWVFVAIKKDKTARSAAAFLKALQKACPIRIQKILTDNGKVFTDRLFTEEGRKPTGDHLFDQLCKALDIEHRLIRPRHPQAKKSHMIMRELTCNPSSCSSFLGDGVSREATAAYPPAPDRVALVS